MCPKLILVFLENNRKNGNLISQSCGKQQQNNALCSVCVCACVNLRVSACVFKQKTTSRYWQKLSPQQKNVCKCVIVLRLIDMLPEEECQVHNGINGSFTFTHTHSHAHTDTHAHSRGTYMEIQTHPQRNMPLISHNGRNAGTIGHYSVGFLPVCSCMGGTVCVCVFLPA